MDSVLRHFNLIEAIKWMDAPAVEGSGEAEEGRHLTAPLMEAEEAESVIEDYHGPVGEKDVPLEEIRRRLAKIPGSPSPRVAI